MALSTPNQLYTFSRLEPVYPGEASEVSVNLPPSVAYAAGTILGIVTASGNDVQTATITGSPTGGTFAVGNIPSATGVAQSIAALAYNATGATYQTALLALVGTGNATVTGGAGGPYVVTLKGIFAGQPQAVLTYDVTLMTGGTPVITNVHTTTGSTAGTYKAYASGSSDGSQVARLILANATSTDSAGVHYFATTAASEWGQVCFSTTAYRNGTFRTADLTGCDATAVTNLGRLLSGTTSAGLLQLI